MKRLHLYVVAILVSLYFLISLLLVLLPAILLRLVGAGGWVQSYELFNGRLLSRFIIIMLGGRVRITGAEHLPEHNRKLCFVSNHRSLADIPLIVGYLPVQTGFIAKKELRKVPILSTWMEALGCVYIDRKNPRSQIKAIIDGAKAVASGHPQVIFPEGTRSRSEGFGEFKPGSIKLATRSRGTIIPLAICNTSYLMENKRGVRREAVELIIHAPIETVNMDDAALKKLPEKVFATIRSASCG